MPMNHVSYGLFEDAAHARLAIAAIEASGTPRRHCGVVLEQGRLDEGLLGLRETAASEAAREGAVIAGAFGAALGGIAAGPAGFAAVGALGALYGALGGALAGAGSPDRRLDQLAGRLAEGKVLVVVEAPSFACRDAADDAMRSNGGEVQHKPFF
jgi:hypothetical protein